MDARQGVTRQVLQRAIPFAVYLRLRIADSLEDRVDRRTCLDLDEPIPCQGPQPVCDGRVASQTLQEPDLLQAGVRGRASHHLRGLLASIALLQ